MKKFLPYFGLIAILYISCSENETIDFPPNEPLTAAEIINELVGEYGEQTWKMVGANLTNSNTEDLNVTDAFNIKDDEFIFFMDGTQLKMRHKARNEFNWDASNFNDFLYDNYVGQEEFDLNISEGETPVIQTSDGQFQFTYNQDNLFDGVWDSNAGSRIRTNHSVLNFQISLQTQNAELISSLNFEEVSTFTVENNFLSSFGSADFLASQSNNSLYIIYRNGALNGQNGGNTAPEIVRKYDVANNEIVRTINYPERNDFFTRRSTIFGNQLYVVGTQQINKYDISTISHISNTFYNYGFDPITYTYFRYDTVTYDNEVFLLGGNPYDPQDELRAEDLFNKILKLNVETGSKTEIASLPTYKSQAAAEIVDGKIYLFGGVHYFGGNETVESLSYIYDVETNSFSTFNLPVPVHVTYAVAVNEIIYIAGEIFTVDQNDSSTIIDKTIFLAAYNTSTGELSEIEHNLDDSDTTSTIFGITHLAGQLYVLYGNGEYDYRGDYSIMAAFID